MDVTWIGTFSALEVLPASRPTFLGEPSNSAITTTTKIDGGSSYGARNKSDGATGANGDRRQKPRRRRGSRGSGMDPEVARIPMQRHGSRGSANPDAARIPRQRMSCKRKTDAGTSTALSDDNFHDERSTKNALLQLRQGFVWNVTVPIARPHHSSKCLELRIWSLKVYGTYPVYLQTYTRGRDLSGMPPYLSRAHNTLQNASSFESGRSRQGFVWNVTVPIARPHHSSKCLELRIWSLKVYGTYPMYLQTYMLTDLGSREVPALLFIPYPLLFITYRALFITVHARQSAEASPDATVHCSTVHCSRPTIVLQPHPPPSPLPTLEPPSGSTCASARRLHLRLPPPGASISLFGSGVSTQRRLRFRRFYPAPPEALLAPAILPSAACGSQRPTCMSVASASVSLLRPGSSDLISLCLSALPQSRWLVFARCLPAAFSVCLALFVVSLLVPGSCLDLVVVLVINLRLTKENYFSWLPAMTMGIAARDRMTYIDGSNPEPVPLILRKKTARDMWVVLEQMYGQKKTDIRTYQVMKTVYNLRQGSSSVAEYYGALKAKWEELDYHSDLPWH
ncbi:hypothetical protein EJ110_NYTH60282, partial [Nymphaea thermarum]